jgi:hypothetical protein
MDEEKTIPSEPGLSYEHTPASPSVKNVPSAATRTSSEVADTPVLPTHYASKSSKSNVGVIENLKAVGEGSADEETSSEPEEHTSRWSLGALYTRYRIVFHVRAWISLFSN